jgi:hypothetical protein
MTAARRRRLAVALGGLGALLLFAITLLAAIHTRGGGLADDAFISFRIARNLGEGHGLCFNANGPRVEAASNFLLTVLLAGAHRAGLSILRTSLIIGVAAAALTLLLLALLAVRACGTWALWAPLALATMNITSRNATTGLETTLLALLLLGGVGLYIHAERGPRPDRRALVGSGLLLALVGLSRPEGPIYVIALGVLRAWDLAARRDRQLALDLRSELCWVGGFSALYLPYLVFRLAYFGQLLPNIYYAKAAQFHDQMSKVGAGLACLKMSLLFEPLILASLLVGGLAYAVAPCRRLRALLAIVIVQCVFIVLSSGDWPHMFGYARFAYPVMPLALWLLAEGGARLLRQRRRLAFVLGVLSLVALNQLDMARIANHELPPNFEVRASERTPLTWQSLELAYLRELPHLPLSVWIYRSVSTFHLGRYHNNFDGWVGLWLRDRYPEARVASIQAGQFAFWSELPFFDLFGLVTPDAARLGRDRNPRKLAAAVKRFDPDLIAWYKWDQGVHHRPLIVEGSLWRAGYGLRYVFQDERRLRAFLVFEKDYKAPEDPQEILFTPVADLPRRVTNDRWIAVMDEDHPRLR